MVTATDLIELSIKIIVRGKIKNRQNNTVGLAVNKTYGLFLYYGRDTHQNALICLDGIELQKGKTDVVFSGILIYFVTQFINLQLNVRMYFGASSVYLYFLQKQKYFIIFFILLSFHT